MPYEISWLVEKRVILARVYGVANIEMLTELNEAEHATIVQGIPLVHLISDTTKVEKVEVSLKDLHKLAKSFKKPEGMGWYVEVHPSTFNRMISSIALQFAGARHREFATIEDAIAFLQDVDESLPPMEILSQYNEIPKEQR